MIGQSVMSIHLQGIPVLFHVFLLLLTLVLLNCFNCIFRHLKMELLTQFPALNDEKKKKKLKIYIL